MLFQFQRFMLEEDSLQRFVSKNSVQSPTCKEEVPAPENEPQAENCDSFPSLECIPDTLSGCPSPSAGSLGDTQTLFISAGAVHVAAEKKSSPSPSRTILNTLPTKEPRSDLSFSNVNNSLSDPFALPLFSDTKKLHSNLNSASTRRKSYGGSSSRYPSSDFTCGSTSKRTSMGAEPIGKSDCHSTAGFIDTHCHLDMLYSKMGFHGSFSRFRKQQANSFSEFRGCITDFCNPRVMGKEALWEGLLSENMVWGAFGCHPHFAETYSSVQERNILHAMQHPKAVAFGEMGLDYSHKNSAGTNKQKEVKLNVRLGNERMTVTYLASPSLWRCLSVSCDWLWPCRSLWWFTAGMRMTIWWPSWRSVFLVITKFTGVCGPSTPAFALQVKPQCESRVGMNWLCVCCRHCFTNSYPVIEPFLAQFPNLYVGFTALITYPHATQARDAVRKVPLNRIVVETDAPYFLPRQVVRRGEGWGGGVDWLDAVFIETTSTTLWNRGCSQAFGDPLFIGSVWKNATTHMV